MRHFFEVSPTPHPVTSPPEPSSLVSPERVRIVHPLPPRLPHNLPHALRLLRKRLPTTAEEAWGGDGPPSLPLDSRVAQGLAHASPPVRRSLVVRDEQGR